MVQQWPNVFKQSWTEYRKDFSDERFWWQFLLKSFQLNNNLTRTTWDIESDAIHIIYLGTTVSYITCLVRVGKLLTLTKWN